MILLHGKMIKEEQMKDYGKKFNRDNKPETVAPEDFQENQNESENSEDTDNSEYPKSMMVTSVHALTLREEPDGKILTILGPKTKVKVLEEAVDGWIKTSTLTGKTGFVVAEHLEEC